MDKYINILADTADSTLKFCDSYNVLVVFYFIKQMLTLLCIIVPIALIVMLTIDVVKTVTSGKIDEDIKRLGKKFAIRFLVCFAFFFLPTIVNLVAKTIQFVSYDASKCWLNADKDYIISLKEKNENDIKNADIDSKNKQNDEENKKKQESDALKDKLDKDLKDKKEKEKQDMQNNNTDNGVLSEQSDEVVENFAAFIYSEVGGETSGIPVQMITGAVFINHFYDLNEMGSEVTRDKMCKVFTDGKRYQGGQFNCNLTFDILQTQRGTISQESRAQVKLIAKLLLDKKFTIPKNIIYQAADYILKNDSAIVWGNLSTGAPALPNVYFGYPSYQKTVDTTDIYGNTVNTEFNYYVNYANELYNKYK